MINHVIEILTSEIIKYKMGNFILIISIRMGNSIRIKRKIANPQVNHANKTCKDCFGRVL